MSPSNLNRQSYFEAIVKAFDGLIYVCSADNRIEFANRRVMEQLGRDPVGEPCHQALYGYGHVCPWCLSRPFLAGEAAVRGEVVLK